MSGIERLEAEVLEINNYNISVIFDYLKTREDLYEKFDNEEKTMDGLYDYLYSKAEKLRYKNMAMVENKLVYIWSINYFLKTNEELGIKPKRVMPPTPSEVIEKVNKKKEEAKLEEKKQEDNQINLFEEVQQ